MNTRPLSIREVTHLLGVHRETVRRYLRLGALRGFQLPSGVWRIPSDEIDRLQNAQSWGAAEELR